MSWQADYREKIDEISFSPDGNEEKVWNWFNANAKESLGPDEAPKRRAFVEENIKRCEEEKELRRLRNDFQKDAKIIGKQFARMELRKKRDKVKLRLRFQWMMQDIVVKYYLNNVQSFVVFGAAMLIMTIGLRSVGLVKNDIIVYFSLIIEFVLLCLWSLTFFYTEEDDGIGDLTGAMEELSGAFKSHPGMSNVGQAKMKSDVTEDPLGLLQGIKLMAEIELKGKKK